MRFADAFRLRGEVGGSLAGGSAHSVTVLARQAGLSAMSVPSPHPNSPPRPLLADPDELAALRALGADPDELFTGSPPGPRTTAPRSTRRRRRRSSSWSPAPTSSWRRRPARGSRWSPRRALRRARRRAAQLLHRPDQGAGQREVLRRCATPSARTTSACSPATPPSTPDAPILCCTAEILANIALREGAHADIDLVVMDEFHYYADPDRGWAWQVPLLELPTAQFLLMSATLGDVTFLREDLTRRTGRPTAGRQRAIARCRCSTTYARRRCTRRSRICSTRSRRPSTSCTSPRRPRSNGRRT